MNYQLTEKKPKILVGYWDNSIFIYDVFFEIYMNRDELKKLIHKELYETIKKLQEKSVPQPYNRDGAREMTPAQIKRRDKIGNKMLDNPNAVKYFKKEFGDEWEDYLWATATNIAIDGGE